ncbi:MAG: sugar phosphate isomerase/epimerase family protein [Promethearchaeota archaeon]
MKIGLSSMFFGEYDMDFLFKIYKQEKMFKIMDIWYDTPFYLMESDAQKGGIVKKIIDMKNELEIETVSHLASVDINPVAYNPKMREISLVELKKSLEFADAIGSRNVVLHGGFNSFGSTFSDYDSELLSNLIGALLTHVEKNNLDIKLCIENDAATLNMTRPLESILELEEILNKFKNIYLTLDMAHVLKSSRVKKIANVQHPWLHAENVGDFIKQWCKKIRIIHISAPSSNNTHWRIPGADPDAFSSIMKSIKRYCSVKDVFFIIEYSMMMAESVDALISLIKKDIKYIENMLEL